VSDVITGIVQQLAAERDELRARLAEVEADDKWQREVEADLEARLAAAEAQADHVSFENEVDTQNLEAKLAAEEEDNRRLREEKESASVSRDEAEERVRQLDIIVHVAEKRLAAAETLVVERWTNECQSGIDRIVQDHIDDVNERLAATEARCASDHSGDGTDMTDKWATSLTESDVLNLRGIIAELRDMPANDRESFRLQAFATRIEEML
jgi:chromosome segregation ATPase